MNGTILVESNSCCGLFSKVIGTDLLELFTTDDEDDDDDSIFLSFVNTGAVMLDTHFNFRSTFSSSKKFLKFATSGF